MTRETREGPVGCNTSYCAVIAKLAEPRRVSSMVSSELVVSLRAEMRLQCVVCVIKREDLKARISPPPMRLWMPVHAFDILRLVA